VTVQIWTKGALDALEERFFLPLSSALKRAAEEAASRREAVDGDGGEAHRQQQRQHGASNLCFMQFALDEVEAELARGRAAVA
jgi:hypothetical protein